MGVHQIKSKNNKVTLRFLVVKLTYSIKLQANYTNIVKKCKIFYKNFRTISIDSYRHKLQIKKIALLMRTFM